MGFVRAWSWEICEYTRISTFLFRNHFLAFTVTEKSIKAKNPNNAKREKAQKNNSIVLIEKNMHLLDF